MGLLISFLVLLIVKDNPYNDRHIPKNHHLKKELKEIVNSSQTWWNAIYAFCSWGSISAFAALWGVPYLTLRLHVSTTQAAMAISAVWIGVGVISPLLGWLSGKLGSRCGLLRLTSLIGLLCISALFYLPSVSFVLSYILLFGIGIAASGQLLTFSLVKDNNNSTTAGTAMGLNNMAVVAGGAILQPLVGVLIHLFWNHQKNAHGVPIYSIENYNIGLIVIPISFLIALIVSLYFLKESSSRSKDNIEDLNI